MCQAQKMGLAQAVSGLIIGVVLVFFITLISDVARAMSFAGVDFWPALHRALLSIRGLVELGPPRAAEHEPAFPLHAWAGLGRVRSAH